MNKSELRIYKPTIGLDAIRILGNNMYSDSAYAIAELIANSHDAFASNVEINFRSGYIEIIDDGRGMTEDDIENSYLNIGSNLRGSDDKKMGRKGIGKLASLFISNEVRVFSKKDGKICGLLISLDESKLKQKDGVLYFPALPTDEVEERFKGVKSGTIIKLIKPDMGISESELRYRVADMFDPKKINLSINGEKVKIARRTMPSNVIAIISIGDKEKQTLPSEYKNLEGVIYEDFDAPIIDGYKTSFSGWVAIFKTINKATLISHSIKENNDINKISIFSRGKLGMENVLPRIDRSRVSDRYISGYIDAKVFEEGDVDMALPNRQGYAEKDFRFSILLEKLEEITRRLSKFRTEYSSKLNASAKKQKEDDKASLLEEWKKEYIKNFTKNNPDADKKTVTSASEELEKFAAKLEVSNLEAPILLVSHSEKDKVFAKLIGNILQKLNFETPSGDEGNPRRALISSLDGWGTESGEDFWDWVIDNCIKHTSNQPARVLFLSSKHSNTSFNVGVEAGIAKVATKVAHKRVITVDDTHHSQVRDVFKHKPSQTVPSLFESRNQPENEEKALVDNLYALLKTIDSDGISRDEIKDAVRKTLSEMRKEINDEYQKILFKKRKKTFPSRSKFARDANEIYRKSFETSKKSFEKKHSTRAA